MIDFHWPWLALLLVLPLLVWLLWPLAGTGRNADVAGQDVALLHPALMHLRGAFPVMGGSGSAAPGARGSWLRFLLLGLLWAALVFAVMRPHWLERHTEVKTAGYDLLLAVDVSRSMEALDFSAGGERVTRLAVIKGVAGRFIEARAGDRVGVVLFGSHAFVLSPLTLDGQAVRSLLDEVVTRIAGDGTAIGDAIGLGVKKLRARPEGGRVLVLVTDGENTAGSIPPRMAARLAAQENIRIYTIGVGSMGLVPFMQNGKIEQVKMELDEELLEEIARMTGGAYFRATDAGALEQIYDQIDRLEKTDAESRSVLVPKPLYRWPLGFALIVLLLLGLFPDGVRNLPRWAGGTDA